MSPRVITVRPDARGTWFVVPDDEPAPISTHGSETEAERAALAHAGERADVRVVVMDRYMRGHTVGPRRRGDRPSER